MTAPITLRATRSGRPLGWWGTMAMITTEAVLFALLLFSYLQLWINSDRWPLGDIGEPELVKSGLRSVVLLASSVPVHLAAGAARDGRRRELRWCLVTGWTMGAVFLLGHFDEWHTTLQEFTPTTNAYGSMFYAITGLHLLHLVVGLIVVAYVWFRTFEGDPMEGGGEAEVARVENGAAYWHFVDVVWVAVYGLLYLSVRVT